jgi:hypothetical protein
MLFKTEMTCWAPTKQGTPSYDNNKYYFNISQLFYFLFLFSIFYAAFKAFESQSNPS